MPLVPGGGEVIEMDHVIKLAPGNHTIIALINDDAPLPPPILAALRGYHWLPPTVMCW